MESMMINTRSNRCIFALVLTCDMVFDSQGPLNKRPLFSAVHCLLISILCVLISLQWFSETKLSRRHKRRWKRRRCPFYLNSWNNMTALDPVNVRRPRRKDWLCQLSNEHHYDEDISVLEVFIHRDKVGRFGSVALRSQLREIQHKNNHGSKSIYSMYSVCKQSC